MSTRGIVTVVTPAVTRLLVLLDRMKTEIGLRTVEEDEILADDIAEVSDLIPSHCNREFAIETVRETFRGDAYGSADRESGFYHGIYGVGHNIQSARAGAHLRLSRTPVASITSISVDGTALDPSEWDVDEDGWLTRLDVGGYQTWWASSLSVVVVYQGGYVLPGQTPTGNQKALPRNIERAAIDLVKMAWFSRKRDPMQRTTGDPGTGQASYWVGGLPNSEGMPTNVQAMLQKYKVEF
jgi:hypothetical protein